jgi:uncharacterized protein YndB with AHSA1/START domain
MSANPGEGDPHPESGLVLSRIFAAPPDLVFKVWTQPEHFMQWWGPHGYTVPFCTIDLLPGGRMHFCMRFTNGQEIWNGGVFQEIEAPFRLVTTTYFADEHGNPVPPTQYGMSEDFPAEALLTVTFEPVEGGKTRLTLRQSVPLALAERQGAVRGWGETFDRLGDFLARL